MVTSLLCLPLGYLCLTFSFAVSSLFLITIITIYITLTCLPNDTGWLNSPTMQNINNRRKSTTLNQKLNIKLERRLSASVSNWTVLIQSFVSLSPFQIESDCISLILVLRPSPSSKKNFFFQFIQFIFR